MAMGLADDDDDDDCGCANNLAVRKYSGASVAKTFGVMRPIRRALSARASTAHSLSCSMRNLAIMLLYEKSRQAYAGKTIFEFAFRYKQKRTWPGAHTAHAKLAGGYVRENFRYVRKIFRCVRKIFLARTIKVLKLFLGVRKTGFLLNPYGKYGKRAYGKVSGNRSGRTYHARMILLTDRLPWPR